MRELLSVPHPCSVVPGTVNTDHATFFVKDGGTGMSPIGPARMLQVPSGRTANWLWIAGLGHLATRWCTPTLSLRVQERPDLRVDITKALPHAGMPRWWFKLAVATIQTLKIDVGRVAYAEDARS